MRYDPTMREPSDRAHRDFVYDNIARFGHEVLTVSGRPRFPEENLRRDVARHRVLDREGYIDRVRFMRWLRGLGYDGPEIYDTISIEEGESP